LLAQSPVFRETFETKTFVIENELKVIEISSKDLKWTFQRVNVFEDAFRQFLAFLYAGKLQNEGKNPPEAPDWVALLPELVNFAVAVSAVL